MFEYLCVRWETQIGKSQGSTSAMIKHLTGKNGPHNFPMGGPTPKSGVSFEAKQATESEEILQIVSCVHNMYLFNI